MTTRPAFASQIVSLLSRTILPVALAGALLVFPALAGVRPLATISDVIDPNRNVPHLRADFRIGGGVFLDGRARFYVERGGKKEAIPPGAVSLTVNKKKDTFLNYNGTGYKFDLHSGLACPLGKFVARGGMLLYSIPPEKDEAAELAMHKAGLVDVEQLGARIAKEFVDSRFTDLLEQADFADDEPIPQQLETLIIGNLNKSGGAGRSVRPYGGGSYFNSASQVTYQVFLVVETRNVDVSGVPLRYSWQYARDGSALVQSVTALSQEWPAGQALTDFSQPKTMATQYDAVSLYQAGGVFRQLSTADPPAFARFVSAACSP